MSKYVQRVLSALRWVDTVEDNRRKDMTWAVLVTILHNMVRRPGSQTDVLATDSYVAGALGVDREHVGDATRRLIAAGALDDITGTPAGQAVRDRRKSSAPMPENARVVRLGRERETSGDQSSRGNDRPQGVERETSTGERETSQLSTDVVMSSERTSNRVGDSTYARGLGTNQTTVQDLRGWLEIVSPSSDVWQGGHALGPKALRTYGYLVASPRPVLPRHLRDDLGISRKRAVELLKDLAAHGLAQRPSDGSPGWVAGPNTPGALQTHQMPAQPEESPMPDVPCPNCFEYGPEGADCQWCGHTVQSQPVQPAVADGDRAPSQAKPLKWRRQTDGSAFVLYSEDGQTFSDDHRPQTGDVVFALVDSAKGYVQALRVDGSQLATHAFLTPSDRDYPRAVAAATR